MSKRLVDDNTADHPIHNNHVQQRNDFSGGSNHRIFVTDGTFEHEEQLPPKKPDLIASSKSNHDHRIIISRTRQFVLVVLALSLGVITTQFSDGWLNSGGASTVVEKRPLDDRKVKVTQVHAKEQVFLERTTTTSSPERDKFTALAQEQKHPPPVQAQPQQQQPHNRVASTALTGPQQLPQQVVVPVGEFSALESQQQKYPPTEAVAAAAAQLPKPMQSVSSSAVAASNGDEIAAMTSRTGPLPPEASSTTTTPQTLSSSSSSSLESISKPAQYDMFGAMDDGSRGGGGGGNERVRQGVVPSFDRSRGVCGDQCHVDYSLSQVHLPHESCRGKERLVEILTAAGTHEINETVCEALPSWESVKDLYGDRPVVYGLDTCQEYRRRLLQSQTGTSEPITPAVRVAGLCNTGTNAFAGALDLNYDPWVKRHTKQKYQVPWGKHLAAKYKWNVTLKGWEYETVNKSEVLPIVIVKDPYRWFASMCKASYFVEWEHIPEHCPNLVRDRRPSETGGSQFDTYHVKVPYWRTVLTDHYDSLADMWSEWINEYLTADYPRLIIRYEDVLFHAERVMELVTTCAVGDGNPPPMVTKAIASNKNRGRRKRRKVVQPPDSFQYYVKKAKKNGHASDFFSALAKAGTEDGRYTCLTESDIEYAATALHPELMDLFHYKAVSVANFTRTSSRSGNDPSSLLCPGVENTNHPRFTDEWALYKESEQEHPYRRPD